MISRGDGCNKEEGHHDFIDCDECGFCLDHCKCSKDLFDADELGLDPESDNTPNAGSRHA